MNDEKATRENWLLKAGNLKIGETLFLYPCGDLTQTAAFAALEAQYGPNLYDTWQHGQALRILRGKSYREGQLYRLGTRALTPDETSVLSENELAVFRERRRQALHLWIEGGKP